MKIDNAQLMAFSTVLREGSFDAAARKLHITASAISQRIKLLEERLGQVLILRSTPCQATAAGKILARHADQLALLEDATLREMGIEEATNTPAIISVAVNADSLDTWFLGMYEELPEQPAISLEIHAEDQDHSAALLREGVVMAAVSASAEPVQGCSTQELGSMRYHAVASPRFIARYFADSVNTNNLARAPLLTFNRKDALQTQFIAQFTKQTLMPPTHFIPSTHGFVEAALRHVGWGMMPAQFVEPLMAAGELAEIAPHHHLDIPLYWHRWRINSPLLDTVSRAVAIAAKHVLLDPA